MSCLLKINNPGIMIEQDQAIKIARERDVTKKTTLQNAYDRIC
jgi:hypothetical protein